MGAIVDLLLLILQLYSWVVIAAVIASWLIQFNAINAHNPVVRQILEFLYALTEPVFQQVRRILPAISGIDLSPLIVLLAIFFLQRLLIQSLY